MNSGKFVISLDFELMWGVFDLRTIDNYGDALKNVPSVIKRTLSLFEAHGIEATFSIVGLLGFKNFSELKDFLNQNSISEPDYINQNLNAYNYIKTLKEDVDPDYFFAKKSIELIESQKVHEISTHTFSHYYCLEPKKNLEAFRNDLKMAKRVHVSLGLLPIKSIIFPRNQYDKSHLQICMEEGIDCYRGNENSWIYFSRNSGEENLLIRGLRLMDSYMNISSHHTTALRDLKEGNIVNIPSSRILRSYNKKLRFIEKLKLGRIKNSMTYAARQGEVYHLWWHPHNFGNNMEENFLNLERICKHYNHLNRRHQFESITMSRLATEIKDYE